MQRGVGPLAADDDEPAQAWLDPQRATQLPGPLGAAAPHADLARNPGWLKFDGFNLIWYDSPYPSTRRVGYMTQAQSGRNIVVARLGIAVAAFQRPFSDADQKDVGPIPEGSYDVMISDAGAPKLKPGYGQVRDESGTVVAVYRSMVGVRGMQFIPPDLELWLDNPRTEENEASSMAEVWGRYRARIIPRAETRTFGRGGFYLHSSKKVSGTHGCIETLGDEYVFLRFMRVRQTHHVRKILLVVRAAAPEMFSPELQGLRHDRFF